MGKGSAPRPIPNRDQYENNWDQIFGNKSKVRVSGVPYEVEMEGRCPDHSLSQEELISELERENAMMRARMERLERELEVLHRTKDDLK
jgi:hypothetical protein